MSAQDQINVEVIENRLINDQFGRATNPISSKDLNIIETETLRVEFDAALQNLKKAELNRRSRERSIAVTKLQEAIMWLGIDLKGLNALNSYPNSCKPDDAIAEPTADGLKL